MQEKEERESERGRRLMSITHGEGLGGEPLPIRDRHNLNLLPELLQHPPLSVLVLVLFFWVAVGVVDVNEGLDVNPLWVLEQPFDGFHPHNGVGAGDHHPKVFWIGHHLAGLEGGSREGGSREGGRRRLRGNERPKHSEAVEE